MKKIKIEKIAVVGTGYFSQYHLDAWKRLKIDVVGICSLDIEKAKFLYLNPNRPLEEKAVLILNPL